MKTATIATFTLGCLTLLMGLSAPALAQEAIGSPTVGQETPKLGITPVGIEGSYFSLELDAETSVSLAVELGNFGNSDESAKTYLADVTTLTNGGMNVAAEGAPLSGTSQWLDYASETLQLDAGARVSRTFTVTVPRGTPSGEYLTSIVIQTASPVNVGAEDQGNLAINQILRQAIAVAITVPGDMTAEITTGEVAYHLSPGSASIRIALENSGNIHLRPKAELVLHDASNVEILRTTINLNTLFAGMDAMLEWQLLQPLPLADYFVSLSLTDDKHAVDVTSGPTPMLVDSMDPDGLPVRAVPGVKIESFTISEVRDSTGDGLLGIELVVLVNETTIAVTNAQLVLHVTHNAVPVEDYVLATSLSYPREDSSVRQRYVPLGGWTSGQWTFSVTLEVVDPVTGTITELAAATTPTVVHVP